MLVLTNALHRGTLPALQFAQSISDDVRAVYVEIDPSRTVTLQKRWAEWEENCRAAEN